MMMAVCLRIPGGTLRTVADAANYIVALPEDRMVRRGEERSGGARASNGRCGAPVSPW